MTDWIKVLLEFLSANKAAVILVFVVVICLGGSFIDGFATLHQQYATWLYLAAAFAISVLIVQLFVWLKDQYFARRAQKLEEERAERARILEEEKAERAQKLEEEKVLQKRRQALERDIRYFNYLTVAERKILLEAFQKKRTTFEVNAQNPSIIRLISGHYLDELPTGDPMEIFPDTKTVVLSPSTIDLLDECFDELMNQYKQDK